MNHQWAHLGGSVFCQTLLGSSESLGVLRVCLGGSGSAGNGEPGSFHGRHRRRHATSRLFRSNSRFGVSSPSCLRHDEPPSRWEERRTDDLEQTGVDWLQRRPPPQPGAHRIHRSNAIGQPQNLPGLWPRGTSRGRTRNTADGKAWEKPAIS